jgi:predicted  nucleic acid-binding Zn-ribbon protein
MSEQHEQVVENQTNPNPETNVNQQVNNTLAPVEAATEARARRMGWVSKDEFRGDGVQWIDAKTFVERAESNANILIERNRALDAKLDKTEAEFRKQNITISALQQQLTDLTLITTELRDFASTSSQRAYKRAKSEIEAEMRQAVAEADVPKFDKAQKELETIDKEAIEQGARRVEVKLEAKPEVKVEETKPVEQQQPPPLAPEVIVFIQANDWFQRDGTLNQYMQECHMQLLRQEPGLTLAQNLAKAKEQVQTKFPEKFGINPRRNDAPVVATTSTSRTAKPKKLGYDDLPADAKEMCARFIKTIPPKRDKDTGKMVPYSRDEYVLQYFGEQEEA